METASFLATLLATLLPVAIAAAAAYRYFSHRERQAVVRIAFREVVDALGSDDSVHRRTGAIMLRRFFDEKTEQGGIGTPYAQEALNVIAATLRNIETGSFQKLLADGLSYAPTLQGADLQKANLQGAYLGKRAGKIVDLTGADFFRADLTMASLKNSVAREAVFYQARMTNTVLKGADLRDANFYGADLTGANFADTLLDGAIFANARNIPDSISCRLDESGRYTMNGPYGLWKSDTGNRIFLSRPGAANIEVRQRVRALSDRIQHQGFDVIEISPDSYTTTGAVSEVRRVMGSCSGVVVIAAPDLQIDSATWRAGTPQTKEVVDQGMPSHWTTIELGMASGLNLPVLLAQANGVNPDTFDYGACEPDLYCVSMSEDHQSRKFRERFDDWCGAVREQASR